MNAVSMRVLLCVCVALLLAAAPAPAQRESSVSKELMERVGDWADYYLDHSPSFAAEETLSQTQKEKKGSAARTIVSDYFSLRFPAAPRDRNEFRDVLRVDGKPIQSDAEREAKWAKLAAAQNWQEFSALIQSPDKYELSPEQFSALDRLAGRFATRYQDRMRYFYAQDTSDTPSRNVLIGYRQQSGEGLAVVDGKSVAVSGQAWVDPDTGRIVRVEESLRSRDVLYYIAVEFGSAQPLDAWLPSSITVRVVEKGRIARESVYEYSNFRSLPTDSRAASSAKP